MSLSYSCIQAIFQETGQKSLSPLLTSLEMLQTARQEGLVDLSQLLNSRETQTQATWSQEQVAQGRENGESLLEKVGRKGSELRRIQGKQFGRETEDSQWVLGKKIRNCKQNTAGLVICLSIHLAYEMQRSRDTDQENLGRGRYTGPLAYSSLSHHSPTDNLQRYLFFSSSYI